MLDTALKYNEELKKLYVNTWFDERYKYYNYRSHWEMPKFDESTWDGHDFVSLDTNGQIIGAIGYSINRPTNSVCGLGILNFTPPIEKRSFSKSDIIFGQDVLQAIKDIFEKFNFHKLNFCVVIGNPVEKTYDRLCEKYGGRIVGIEREETKLCDNKYYDVKRYEILRTDYFKKRGITV